MSEPIVLEYDRAPSALRYMFRAFVPKARRVGALEVPPIRVTWRGLTPNAAIPSGLCVGNEPSASGDPIDPVHLHAAGMRLMMAILTHPRFPVPIWNVLQVRNRIVRHRQAGPGDRLEASATVTGWRTLAKGAEFDLGVEMSAPGGRVLESVSTFYARGSFGPEQAEATGPSAPEAPTTARATWSIPRRGVWGYARLTGDYNGIHWANRYARALGFASAFSHPHRALAQIVSRLPRLGPEPSLGLEVWFKGPAYYGQPLELAWERDESETRFALRLQGDPRPAILGRLRAPSEVSSG